MSDDETIDAVRGWVDELCRELGIPSEEVDIDAVLGIAGLAARTVVRPAAPVTTYLLGYATGLARRQDDDPRAAFDRAKSVVRRVVAERGPEDPPPAGRTAPAQ